MRKLFCCVAVLAFTVLDSAYGAPYMPVPVGGDPVTGPDVMRPHEVWGKEFSHDEDYTTPSGAADPEQVINWDGVGGTLDGFDYSGTRPSWDQDRQVDALANRRDGLFRHLINDDAHLVYSHDDVIGAYAGPPGPGTPFFPVTLPSAAPVTLASGMVIGGAGELSVERSGIHAPGPIHEIWAKQPEIDGMKFPNDVDGVEVWGPEPPEGGEQTLMFPGDADKYSLEFDFESGTSVWNLSGTPYMSHAMIVGAVTSMLGPVPGSAVSPHFNQEGPNLINLDALMVYDTSGRTDHFDFEPLPGDGEDRMVDQLGRPIFEQEPRDTIVFSIGQILNPMDPDGYYATGSELFVLDSMSGVSYLRHGGHVWDHGYTLAEMRVFDENQEFEYGVLDINAIEAVGEGFDFPVGPCPGDFNNDGVVDLADYTVWRNNLGETDETKIASNGLLDGIVDGNDFSLWRSNYGHVCPMLSPVSANVASVPEPATLWTIGLALAVGAVVARRKS